MVRHRRAPEVPEGDVKASSESGKAPAGWLPAPRAERAHVPDHDLPGYARPGAVLADKYRIERVLGRGGMGLVVLARHLHIFEPVALKFLLPEYQDDEAVGRFKREGWAATRIKSEYVARVSDVATLPDGLPYMVMEYLEGEDLASALRRGGPLPVEQAVEFVLQACEGLAEAHAHGIVHRDLKPSNMFKLRRSDGLMAIKVLDFGISKVTHTATPTLGPAPTTSAVTMGSPTYMSPEQMYSTRDVDTRTDVWALGVILYEMIAGRTPFVAGSLPELAVKVVTEAPPALRSLRRDAPRGIERVLARCLEKSRDKRYPDVAELARDLTEFAPPRATAHAERAARILRVSSGERAAAESGGVRPRPEPASAERASGRSPVRPLLWIASLLALVFAVAAVIMLRRHPAPTPAAAEQDSSATPAPAAAASALESPGLAVPPTPARSERALQPQASPITQDPVPSVSPAVQTPLGATPEPARAPPARPLRMKERPSKLRERSVEQTTRSPAARRKPSVTPAEDSDVELGGRI